MIVMIKALLGRTWPCLSQYSSWLSAFKFVSFQGIPKEATTEVKV